MPAPGQAAIPPHPAPVSHASAGDFATLPAAIGRYRVERLLGEGTFGRVFLARDDALERLVAIKVPHARWLARPGAIDDYIREARVMARLDHPHIVPVYDVGPAAELGLYVVSKYVAGTTLQQRIAASRLSHAACAELIAQVADALHYAHQRGFFHRDVKPGNILLDAAGQPYLADFGLALRDEDVGQGPHFAGTPAYMSPEQAAGQGHLVDGRSDVFSLGVVLYELLTGTRPFRGDVNEIIRKITSHDARPPRQIDDSIPKELERACLTALARKPADRYTTALDFARDLRQWLQSAGPREPVRSPKMFAAQEPSGGKGAAASASAAGASSEPTEGSDFLAKGHNLPVPLTSFVGRGDELSQVRGLLQTTRLLTLTGVGGCGKTRLALELAAQVRGDYRHGAWFVELAPLSDPSLVVQAVAGTLGVREQATRPLLEVLTEVLGSKQLLIILDNCEHLLHPAARLAEAILKRAPGIKLLATSREALRVPGEVAWRVPSLDVPPSASAVRVEDLLPHAAVRLFMDRAQAANPALRLCDENAAAVAQICRRLDGIPLALELAAARARALSPEQIAARLDRRFQLLTGGSRAALQRQQTLHAAVAWSYDLLTPPERELFHRLAVFAGEFDLDTVESVCADDLIEPSQILDLLAELLDKSLVSARPQGNIVRYRMLETLRAFAAEKLAAAGDEPRLRRRHLDHCLAATHDIATRLMTGGQQVAVLAAVDTEVDNLRAALAWALEHAPQDALRLAVALGNYWYHRGHWGEARDVMRRALDRGAAAPPQLRARGLWFLAVYAYRQSDYGEADLLSRQSLELHEQTGDFPGMTDPLNLRGLIAWERTDLSAARATHQQCLALCESLGNRRLILRSYGNLALVLADQGEYAAAVAMTSQSLQLAREIGNRWMEGLGIINLGRYALLQGDIDGSRTLLEQGLAVGRELRDRYTLAWGLNPLGEIARRRGLFDQARACFQEALTACAQVGEKREQGRGLRGMARLAMDQGAWDEAERLFAESVRLLAGIGCRGDVAESFEALAQLAAIRLAAPGGVPNNAPPAASDSVQSAASTAAFRLGAAQAVRNALALPLPPLFHAEVAQTRAALTQRLGAADFEAIFSRGTALTLEQALAEAAPPQPSHA